MQTKLDVSEISDGRKHVGWFWFALIVAVIFTIMGIHCGDLFEAYQTAATL